MINWNEVFEYKEGCLYWLKSRQGVTSGSKAGCTRKDGYVVVSYKDRSHLAHRIIYEMHYGDIPDGLSVDHINRISSDNRIENLRAVTHQENHFNRKAKGCSYAKSKGKWKSYIVIDNKYNHLGYYNTEEEAEKAYQEAKDEFHKIKCKKYKKSS